MGSECRRLSRAAIATVTPHSGLLGEFGEFITARLGLWFPPSPRTFEPFFTTRRDVGSGLGLSAVQGSATDLGCTTITIGLPASVSQTSDTRAQAPLPRRTGA